ncbi:MAG: hypothetical protein IT352_00810 [Gemmatimonadales bacterium]|nr:hypothetical protein [Gemmatimonadales bacterium]
MTPHRGRGGVSSGWVAALLLGAVAPAAAQAGLRGEPFEQAHEVERLLPQSSVYDILEDRAGFLWFGTREGVARWDGYQVRTWKHDPFSTASLPGNVVRAVVEDRSGAVWLQTYSYLDLPAGVARISGPGLTEVTRFRADGTLALDGDGVPWLVTADSVLRFESGRREFRGGLARTAGSGGSSLGVRVAVAVASRDGLLWILDPARGLERCHLGGGGCAQVPPPVGGHWIGGRPWRDPDGAIWVTAGRVVVRFHEGHSEAFEVLPPGDVAVDLAAGPDRSVWILSRGGVARLAGGVVVERHPLPTLANAPNPAPVRIVADRAGAVWVGTVWGLYRRVAGRAVFGHLEHDPRKPTSPSAGLVVSLAEGPDGAIWIGTIGGGLNRWNRATGEVRRFRRAPSGAASLSNDMVWALAADSAGTVWAGTNHGITRFGADGSVTRLLRDRAIPWRPTEGSANTVTDLEIDREGRLWFACGVACSDSLYWYDPARGRFGGIPLPGVTSPGYLSLAEPAVAWVGAVAGLFRVDLATGGVRRMADSGGGNLDGVLAFRPIADGGLWVGANSGLYRYDPAGRLVARYTDRDGLPSHAVYGILEDRRGRIWVSTNRGLAVIETDSTGIVAVRTYDHTNGLGNTEFNRNAAIVARDGTFLFGGDRGVTYFDPDRVTPNEYQPPVVITGVSRSTQRGPRVTPLAGGEVIRIAADEYTFTLEFAALNYRNPHRNRYQVMLEGFDADWKVQGMERRATYTNVPPGRYWFRVRGSNDDGVWSAVPASVVVVVEPAFWETGWFRWGGAALVMGLISLSTWYVSRNRYRFELEAARAQHALDAERARISRDMHDEIGANLTEIAILSDLAIADGRSGVLGRIGEKARTTLDAIGEIVWATDPRNDDGDRFAAYLRAYAAEFLESTGVRSRLDFPEPGALPPVTAELRRTVFLVLKEALSNAARHSGATSVGATLRVVDGWLTLVVDDDGEGFEPTGQPDDGSHHGLRNMATRASDVGGVLTIDSASGRGTTVTLRVPTAGREVG